MNRITNRRDPDEQSDEQRVQASLRALAIEDARVTAPPHLETTVMRAWGTYQARRPRRAWRRPWITLAWRLAAVALALSTIYLWLPARRAGTPVAQPGEPGAAGRVVPGLVRDAGVPLVTDPPGDPAALSVMRVRMSRSALASLGFPILDPDSAGVVDVEVLVGEDGVARSIRRAAFAETRVIEE